MKIEKQGYGECMLATIAALAEVPLDEVREAACKKAKVDEWDYVIDRPLYWPTVRYLVKRFKVKGIPLSLSSSYAGFSKKDASLSGRGSIYIDRDSSPSAHIMPFEDGLIYDTASTRKPFPLADLAWRYPGWKVYKITKE